jgi:hypothetical protein
MGRRAVQPGLVGKLLLLFLADGMCWVATGKPCAENWVNPLSLRFTQDATCVKRKEPGFT